MDRVVRWTVNRKKKAIQKDLRKKKKRMRRTLIIAGTCLVAGYVIGVNRQKIAVALLQSIK